FNDIMKMHVFETPSRQAQELDPLYQIRSIVQAINDHIAKCIIPGKYLVIDEFMNQWLGTDMPNLKKVLRKPHPIGQEFKTLADNHCYCILRMKKLTITVKRLVKPWFGFGRTVIADSWFGSPDMVSMLMNHGLYSIMQVTKHRYWPQGMFETDIIQATGRCLFALLGLKKLTGEKTFKSSDGNQVTINRTKVVDEYERHRLGSVDAANNLRDNLTSYHDIISTERRVFSEEGASRGHLSFKDNLAFNLLEHCKKLKLSYMKWPNVATECLEVILIIHTSQ
ncbi:hypothetical protein CU097_005367, partial [Rhizopus azygosporus]